jgi:superfamily II DNA or RNA helicase
MTRAFKGWEAVARAIERLADQASADPVSDKAGIELNEGQVRSLRAIAARLTSNGVILADEVGMGKTRIAAAVARAVIDSGGRVAFLLPPGLGLQWSKELASVNLTNVPPILRSLGGYLEAWEKNGSGPWFKAPAVMISHVFANWRLGKNSQAWRWALLPLAFRNKVERTREQTGRYPRGWQSVSRIDYDGLHAAAKAIGGASSADLGTSALARRSGISRSLDWTSSLDGKAYARDRGPRSLLEQLIGVGLGTFDLIVIDEAHKSRGEESGLSRLLQDIVIGSDHSRRIAMTATPVELDVEQWIGMLSRIGVDGDVNAAIGDCCRRYAKALETVRLTWRSSDTNRNVFVTAARAFEEALKPYVLRRDKREDETIKTFQRAAGGSIGSYRRETPIEIHPENLPKQWLQAVFAAEALSAISQPEPDERIAKQDKLLRLTVGSGHGIAAMLDSVTAMDDERKDEGILALSAPPPQLRAEHWRRVIRSAVLGCEKNAQPATTDVSTLYQHPSIAAAIQRIEEITARREKVLVFGRFTRPMKALEQMINARAMLRHLQHGLDWPQGQIMDGEERAVQTALAQLNIPWSMDEVSSLLADRFKSYGNRPKSASHLASAALDLIGSSHAAHMREAIEEAADRIIASLSDDDSPPDQYEAASGGSMEYEVVDRRGRSALSKRIAEEYGAPRGSFARRMYGETKPHTRRNIQLKFNRAGCFPFVLIAQSTVGREGLNLHEACRHIVLLHPEWNPGIVEQQIGRVDRLGSQWHKDFKIWHESRVSNDPPRIEILPIVFKGTYDEHNWDVLKRRWDNLRGQLHRIIVPDEQITHDERRISDELNNYSPKLSP